MVKRYTFNYFNESAFVEFLIDTDIVTREQAIHSIDYYKTSKDDPELYIDYMIDIHAQLLQYYALEVIINASVEYADLDTQKKWFNQDPGLLPIDGSKGIELLSFTRFDFYNKRMTFEVEPFNNLTFKASPKPNQANTKYIITGMPCSGKTTLAGIMGKKGLNVAKGYTTRPPRDEHDKEYFFQTREAFDIENTIHHEYNGWLYGFSTISLWVDNVFVAGPELALKLQAFFKRENCILIWLDPPEWTIKQRLRERVMPGDTASARFKRDAKTFRNFEKLNAHDLRIQSFNGLLRPWMDIDQ